MDKFGSHSRKRIPVWRMFQDLNMNDHRITSLGLPRDSSDAVTKKWVTQQLKEGMKDMDELDSELKQMQMTIKRMQRVYEASIKDLTKKLLIKVDKTECVSTNGGLMTTNLDMQGHAIHNLSEGTRANEPVTKGWYAKNWQEAVSAMQGRIEAIDKKIKSHHG